MLPILLQSHNLILYSYPMLMGLGWGIAYQIYFSLVPEDIPRRFPQILFWGIFFFAWFGSKILFYFTVPEIITKEILMEASFWFGGGFVFYGGFIGGMIFLILYKSFGAPFSIKLIWPMVPALTFGHAIGRIGCFLAGCCYGAPTTWPWSVHLHGQDRHPTQLLETVALLALGRYLLKSKRPKAILISYYFIIYGIIRIVIESLRGDMIRGQWGILTPSQWISILLIIAGSSLLLRLRNHRVSTNTAS